MGGASGAAFRNPLTGTGHLLEELVAREAIQNSSDAPTGRMADIGVDFCFEELLGEAKGQFVKIAQLKSELDIHAQKLKLPAGNTLEQLDDNARPLRLLYINDWNTHGLSGPAHDDTDDAHFFKFALAIGDADKAYGDQASGGSYGYGKSVFAAASDINTIFIYTVFAPTAQTDGAHARLMGLTWLDKHRIEPFSYTGRGWFGLPGAEGAGVVDPLLDDDAHSMAESLGFIRRTPEDTGLSILIVGSVLSVDELRKGIETHWWPRLEDKTLDVRISVNGKSVEPPRPMKRTDLKPFVACYRKACGIEDVTPPTEVKRKLSAISNLETGVWVASAVEQEDLDYEDEVGLVNRVALLRSPRMVVDYLKVGRPYRIPIIGVFVADSDIDAALRLSEPPAHDKWDVNSYRLMPDQRDLVEKVLTRLRINIQNFQDGLQPKEESVGDRVIELEKMLGNLFHHRHKNRPPQPKPPVKRPVEIRLTESRVPSGTMAVGRALVRLKLRDDAGIDCDTARITGTFEVLAQDTHNIDEILATSIVSHSHDGALSGNENSIAVPITKEEWSEIEFESAEFDADWLIRFSLNAEKENG